MAGEPSVLFVDDEEKSRKYFRTAMRGVCEVVAAASVDEAIAVLREQRVEFGVLVTDQRMPKRNGLELLQFAYQEFPQTVRMLTTAYIDLDNAIAAVNRGAISRYIVKPWEIDELRGFINEGLAQYRENRDNQELLFARRQNTLRVAANMAHELRTPLASIRAATSGLNRSFDDLVAGYRLAVDAGLVPSPLSGRHLSALAGSVSRIESDAMRAGTMIDMLLANAGMDSQGDLDMDRCSAQDLFRQAVDSYPFKSNELGLTSIDTSEDFLCRCSPMLMIYVLYNLLRNALYAIAANGEGAIRLSVERRAGTLVMIVRDTGTGVPEHIRDRLFDDFFTTKQGGSGNGIGLSFCKRAIDRMGGSIECQSEFGLYTEFVITLPAESDAVSLNQRTLN